MNILIELLLSLGGGLLSMSAILVLEAINNERGIGPPIQSQWAGNIRSRPLQL